MKSSHGDDGSDGASMSSDDEEYDPGNPIVSVSVPPRCLYGSVLKSHRLSLEI